MKLELTKYERARIIGARALQVSQGAPLLMKKPTGVMDPVTIAITEFKAGKIPMNIERPEH